MDVPWQSSCNLSPDDDLIEYSVKRWAPFICREQRRIVSISTDDILHEYARRLTKPVSEIIDRYRKIHNSRRRHRPKRGLSMIWNVNTNRPRVVFYWTNGRSHFWCCDPLQLCPARFLGDYRKPSKETFEDMVNYSLNVLSYFDPSPVIEGARHRPAPEYLVALYDDEDSSASEETFRPSLPTSSRTPSPAPSTMDDPIIPYRPDETDESSSDIDLLDSDEDKNDIPERPQPLDLQQSENVLPDAATASTQTPVRTRNFDDIVFDNSDIDNVIATIQGVKPMTGNDLLQTVQTIRHRSIFSPAASFYSPLIPGNITFPANVRPVPIMFDIPRPIQPTRFHAETQTDNELSQSSIEVAPTQDQPLVSSDTTTDAIQLPDEEAPAQSEAPVCADNTINVVHSPVVTGPDESQPLISSGDAVAALRSSDEMARVQDEPLTCSDCQMETEPTALPSQLKGEHLMTQSDEPDSQSSPSSFWRQHFPYILHFCTKSADVFEFGSKFESYIRFDYEDISGSPRQVVAIAMSTLAPSILVKWICNQSLIEAPFASTCKQQYALVPFAENQGICLCLNESAWQEFGHAALLEAIRRKPELTGPDETLAEAWSSVCKRYLENMQKSYSIERFHDDIIDALTHEETRSDNANLVPIPTQTRASGDSEKIEMLPLSDLFNVPTQPKSTEIEAPAADFQSQALGHEIREESQPIVGDGISQTLNYLLDNVASQLAA